MLTISPHFENTRSQGTDEAGVHKKCYKVLKALKFKTVSICHLSERRRGSAIHSPDWTANQSGDSFWQRSSFCFGRHMSRVFLRTKASFEAVLLWNCSPGFEARIEASVSRCHHYCPVQIIVLCY
ncbi:hypothetical protein D9C73_005953 [Collichthys lucidus]|uniref:Uncharacterized protein n=1 Tax=Collichthys lucidus TaxID=240159 RepID=A0A4U5U8M9_COLLU|nr:hypothetical protein D9C73_005953 [Collichthys lucidus]